MSARDRSKSDGEIRYAGEVEVGRGCEQFIINMLNTEEEENDVVVPKENAVIVNRENVECRKMPVMKQLVPLLLIIAGIKFQDDQTTGLFTDYIVQVWFFVGAASIYWLTIEVTQKMKTSLDTYPISKFIINCITLDCMIVSVFSLVSLLFPRNLPHHVFVATTSSSLILGVIVSCVRFRKEILASEFTKTFKGMLSKEQKGLC